MGNTISHQERAKAGWDHGMHGCVSQTRGLRSKTLSLFVQSCELFTAIIFLLPHLSSPHPPQKKKGQAQQWSTFQRMTCFISPKCSSAFEENVAVVVLKNNKKLWDPFESGKCWQHWQERHGAFQSSGMKKKILNKTILCDFAGGLSYHFICTFVPLLIGMFI